MLDDGKSVKINFTSSGQQESVWILNLLFYYLLQKKKILFIIEEPESHLFPESQKYITELIALVNNCNHSVVLTTHSPYVLGTLNNLLYVHGIHSQYSKKADKIIPQSLWLDFDNFNAWFVKNGTIDNCMDPEIHMIQNERIDEISKVINNDFDKLLELQDKGNPQYHRGINPAKAYVTHYKIDGTVIKTGNRCDYLLMNEQNIKINFKKKEGHPNERIQNKHKMCPGRLHAGQWGAKADTDYSVNYFQIRHQRGHGKAV